MFCAQCGAEDRDGSNYCRHCSAPLTQQSRDPNSGYIPSVLPPSAPGASAPPNYYAPPNYQTPQPSYQTPQPTARPGVSAKHCVRCNSTTNVIKGAVPLWAIIVAVIGAPFTIFFSLLLLLVKGPNKCLTCGGEPRTQLFWLLLAIAILLYAILFGSMLHWSLNQ